MKISIHVAVPGIHRASKSVDIDVSELGFDDQEWGELTDHEKDEEVLNYIWATELLQWGYDEVPG